MHNNFANITILHYTLKEKKTKEINQLSIQYS